MSPLGKSGNACNANLRLRTADFLQEWCDDFDPAAEGEPVITAIKVTKDARMAQK